MKTIFKALIIFAFAACISQSVANDLEDLDPAKPSVGIMDLPFELLLEIFTQLDLTEAISVAKTHPHNREVVNDIIRRLLSNRTLKISSSSYSIRELDDTENPVEFETILDLFKYFGHYITKLTVQYSRFANQTEYETLNEYISKYGATSLKEIDFYFFRISSNPLVGLEGTFQNVEYLRLRGIRIHSFPNFTTMFPSVRTLNVRAMNSIEKDLIHHFPNLERLTVSEFCAFYSSEYESFKQTIESHPKLKHITLPRCQWETLELLGQIRPDLESLEINNLYLSAYDNVTVPLRFSHMKTFKCTVLTRVGDIPLEFGNLEEIEFSREDHRWIEIIMQNRNLKKIVANSVLSDQQLERIADGLGKLEEISMNCFNVDDFVERVVQFARKAKQLKKLSLSFISTRKCREIAEEISDEWKNIPNELDCTFVQISLN